MYIKQNAIIMKITISSILSSLAVVAVVSGFILPNHGRMVPHNNQLHPLISSEDEASASSSSTTMTTAAFISKFRSNSRLLMSETRTFERREGRGGDSYERREYQGRGGGGRGGRGEGRGGEGRGGELCYFTCLFLHRVVFIFGV